MPSTLVACLAEAAEVYTRVAEGIASFWRSSRTGAFPVLTQSASESDPQVARRALAHLVWEWSTKGIREQAAMLDPILAILSTVLYPRSRGLR